MSYGFSNLNMGLFSANALRSMSSSFTPSFNNYFNNTSIFGMSMPMMPMTISMPAMQSMTSMPAFNLNNLFSQIMNNQQAFMPQYNVGSFGTNVRAVSSVSRTSQTRPVSTQTYRIGKFNLDYWKSKGYNHEMGQRLAMDAVSTCPGKADGGCVGYTRRTINRLYGTKFTNAGAAYNFGNKILSDPSLKGKFRKVDMKDIERGGMPDGAIVIWKPGAPGYTKCKAALYGHGGIAYQNKVYSDCIIRNLSTCCEVWIPV